MVIRINKLNPHQIARRLRDRYCNHKKTGNLAKHFGKLQRGLDGMEFQISARKTD